MMTDNERAAWLADKICNGGDYAKEAAALLQRWPDSPAPRALPLAPSEAVRDVLAEREKQRTNYGDPHDDEHGHRILSDEAAGYLMSGQAPMRASWCYNSKVRDRDPRRMQLVKGVALGLAAIECLDRGPRYRATAPQALPMEPSDRAQFSAAMVDGGWDAPATNGRGDAFLFERDEDRYVGWKLARATPAQATLPASEAVAWRVPIAGEYEYFKTMAEAQTARDEYENDGGPMMNLDREYAEPVYTRAQPQADAAEPVAWEVRRTDGSPLACWEACTKDLFDLTRATGRYYGLDNGPPCEVRALVPIEAQAPGARGDS